MIRLLYIPLFLFWLLCVVALLHVSHAGWMPEVPQ